MTRLPVASTLLLALVMVACGCGRWHRAEPPTPPSSAAPTGSAVPEPASLAVENSPAKTESPPAAAPGQTKAAPEPESPPSSRAVSPSGTPKAASATPAPRPAPPSTSQPPPHKVSDETLVRLIRQYPHLITADVLDATPTGDGWTLRIRDPEGMGPMMTDFQIDYEKRGYAAKECRVKVVDDLGHGILRMTRGARRFELSCDQDPTDKTISIVRLKGLPPVSGNVNSK